MSRLKQHAIWGQRGTFILAATGSAVGLGNIWKFPYITGENGGGAFVLVYLACIALVGIPIMMAEVMLGRRGRANPIFAMEKVAHEAGASQLWKIIGIMGVLAGFLILSFYTVIGGWTLEYFWVAIQGQFAGLNGDSSTALFNHVQSAEGGMIEAHGLFSLMTLSVLALGVNKGLEAAVRIMMPLLFALLLVLLGFAYNTGEFGLSWNFMFSFNAEDLTWESTLVALGHAFFTLSLGMGAIMAYGSYMPHTSSISRTVVTVALLDTLVAIMAGLAIFAFVFATPGIAPAGGPGLMFVTLPVAFGNMTGGTFIGGAFFLMVILAAWSSSISILEPAVAYVTERFNMPRLLACLMIGFGAWLLGLGSVFSFNIWADKQFLWGKNFFDSMDFIATNILLPAGGFLIALFVGWVLKREQAHLEFRQETHGVLGLWRWVLKYVSPLLVLAVLINGLYPLTIQVLAE